MSSNRYIPEFNYHETNYKPFKGPPIPDMCKHCENYYAMLYEEGKTSTPFPPNCQRHILNNLEYVNREDFETDGEFQEAQLLLDPVSWAAAQFDWHPRWYQEWMLSCSNDLKIYRCGRRVGKCNLIDTPVLTPTGPVKIQDLKPGDTVYDEHGRPIKVKEVFDQGIQDVVDLSNNGKVVATCTENHPWLTKHNRLEGTKVRQVKDFYKGTKICRTEVEAPLGDKQQPYGYVLGALLGDGCSRSPGLVISSADEVVVAKVAANLQTTYKQNPANFSWSLHTKDQQASIKHTIPYYTEWIHNKYAHEKTVDLEVLKTWNRESLLEFVAGLIDTDGSVHFNGKEITVSLDMQAKPVVEAFQYALLALWQIQTMIGVENRDKYKNGPVYYIRVKHIYHCKRILKELDSHLVCSRKKYKPEYDSLIPNNFDPTSVGVTISNPRKAQCYDIHVDSDTNLYLLANGLVTHNTEGLVIETLHFLFTHSECNIVMCAPREKQVTRFFDEIAKFIRKSPDLSESIQRHVKSPARIEFKNYSKISGFTLNPNQGDSASVNVRGQDANLIVVDELDFIADKDLDVLFAIKASHPDCKIIAATTPSGERKKFYKMVTEKDSGWKEFWFVSQESPSFTEQTERFFRGSMDEVQYEHEVRAEFGEPAEGVFKKKYLDAAIRKYSMDNATPKNGLHYILGIDWNKSHGTHMVILEHAGAQLKMVEKIVIPESEYMQTASVAKIIELNTKWNFKYILVDAGYGSTQVELLKKHGLDHPETDLQNKVIPFAMNQKLNIKDPVTGEEVGKFTKPYLVQQTVKLLEDGALILPASEDTAVTDNKDKMGLLQQMRNYKVESYSVYGQPQYSKEDEHTLVAYFIACGGYVYLDGELSMVGYDDTIVGIEISSELDKVNPNQLMSQTQYENYIKQRDKTNITRQLPNDKDPALYAKSGRKIAPTPERSVGITNRPGRGGGFKRSTF